MLDVSPALVLVTVVTFLVTLYLLNKILYKPLLAHMEKRDEAIERDSKHAMQNSDEVSEYYQEAERILKEAKMEASKMKSEELSRIRELVSQKVESKKAELESEYGEFLDGLQKERAELKESLIAQMPIFKDSVKAKLSQI